MFYCHYCQRYCKNKNSLSAHERLCPYNPSRRYVSHTLGKTAWNKGKTKSTDDRVAKYANSLVGRAPAGRATWSSKQKSDAAKKQGFGGYQEKSGRSKKFEVIDSFGNRTVLQSTYELRCSEILNELKIKWLRPKSLVYNGKKYFADFYLPDFGIYLDPKNSYKAVQDAEKIACVCEQNNVKVYVLTEHMLTTEYIKNIVS